MASSKSFHPEQHLKTDIQGKIEEVHPAIAQQMQQKVGNLVGQPLADFIASAEQEILQEILERFHTEPPQALDGTPEFVVAVDVGGSRPLQLVAQPVLNERGEPVGFEWFPARQSDEASDTSPPQIAGQSGAEPAPAESAPSSAAALGFDRTKTLYRLSHALLLSQSLPQVLQSAVDHIGYLLKECRLLLMVRPSPQESMIRVVDRRGDRHFPDRVLLDSAIRTALMQNWNEEADGQQILRRESGEAAQAESWTGTALLLPMHNQSRVIGTLLALHPQPNHQFSQQILPTLREMLEQTGIAVGNVQLRREAEQRANEMAQYSEKLLRTNAELQRFLHTASHDFQEPLRMIGSYVQLLARRYQHQLDEDADTFISFALKGVTHLQSMISDLLLYANLEGKSYQPTQVDSNEAFEQALFLLKDQIDAANARISTELLPVIDSDPFLLTQLFHQLMDNALKFRNQERPHIVVTVVRDQNFWIFRVQDDGIGIDPAYHDKIFDIFQRLHTRSEYRGTGMGLAIARKIVEWHGGRIWVESRVGQGATFCLSLPL